MNDRSMDIIIGIDFDNTIVSYDDVFYNIALQKGLIPLEESKSKKNVRDAIRRLPGGEEIWTRLQGDVYGPKMPQSHLIDGVERFFCECRKRGYPVYIISHKTEYARYDETHTNLRSAALEWMDQHRFFDPGGIGLYRSSVYFGATRDEKIAVIRKLKCSHFIDDLEEVLNDGNFPLSTQRILYDPHDGHSLESNIISMNSWNMIYEYFFGA